MLDEPHAASGWPLRTIGRFVDGSYLRHVARRQARREKADRLRADPLCARRALERRLHVPQPVVHPYDAILTRLRQATEGWPAADLRSLRYVVYHLATAERLRLAWKSRRHSVVARYQSIARQAVDARRPLGCPHQPTHSLSVPASPNRR